MELTLLGTGNPLPDPARAGPSQLVRIGDDRLLVDCGSGAVRRLVEAGHQPSDVDLVFITHMHSDHTIDLGHFIITRWIQFPMTGLTLIGPPGLREYRDNLLRLIAWDIKVRDLETRLSANVLQVDVIEIDDAWAMEHAGWRVRATRVDHYPVEHAFGFRFDGDGASLVISGDTAPCEALVQAAAGTDILVHDAWLKPTVELARTRMSPEQAEEFIRRRDRYHTDSHDVGKIAARVDPKLLILTHLGPIDTQVLAEHVAADFPRFVVGADLLRFDVGTARAV